MSDELTFKIDVTDEISALITKASKSNDSSDAMRFSQAACNAANAMACIRLIQDTPEELDKK